ncbi:MAG: hypothetical protein ACK2TV_14025 [Anaerolineales bacterium]
MKRMHLEKSRLIIGLLLLAFAAVMFFFSDVSTTGIAVIGVLGVIAIILSIRR